MESNWESIAKGKRFVSDIGKSLYRLDSTGKPQCVGRYAVWYPIEDNKNNSIKQSHQIVEVGDDLNELASKHSIEDQLVFRIIEQKK